MITIELSYLWQLIGAIGMFALPALAAWVSVKVGVSQALSKAESAEKSAERAHVRIDELQQKQGPYCPAK